MKLAFSLFVLFLGISLLQSLGEAYGDKSRATKTNTEEKHTKYNKTEDK